MVGIGKKTLLRDVNPPLICPLCRGYLIDATTVVECLHSFCRSCILKHLRTAGHCPSCKHVLNKAKPNIKADKTLQDIVYKLVPGLYHKEMRKRREFYKMHPEQAKSATPEQRGEDVSGRLIFNPEDVVSLSLEYLPPGIDPLTVLSIKETEMNSNSNNINGGSNNNSNHFGNTASNRRYLQCPALVTIAHLKKFVAMKYSVDVTRYTIEICHLAPLPENWTLMDVAYIYAWKRIAPMRFFYRVAQEEQRLEAPVHHRPSTPGLGARDCLPPNDTLTDDSNVNSEVVNHRETSKSEVKAADDNETTSLTKDSTRSDETSSVSRKQIIEKNETSKISTESVKPPISTSTSNLTHATLPTTSTSPSPGTNTSSFSGTNASSSTTTRNDSNRQIKSPIKILKNSDGRYEVLKNLSSTADTSEKGQTAATANVKCPANPEFSVVNSNGVKITLKQCSPLQQQSNSSKKPKIISNTLLRPAPTDKDAPPMSAMAVLQQLQQQQKQQEKEKLSTSPPSMDKQEKQRRKVTFVDRLSTSEKSSPSAIVPKTALKKPAEQQDKKQFLQSFQLTARETPLPDDKLKSPVRDTDATASAAKCLQNSTAISKVGEFSKKDADEVKKKNNTENTNLTANNSTANTVTNKRTVASVTSAGTSARTHGTSKADGADGRSFNSGTSLSSGNIASGDHTAKIDVYTFPNDPIVPAGAVKRKCPPGVPIADLKRQKSQQIVQKAEVKRKQNVSRYNPTVKLPRISPKEHAIPTSRATTMAGDHSGGPGRTSSAHNAKTSTGPLLSNETRDILMDGYGLNIPASLSITLTSPKSPGTSGQFIEPSDSNDNDGRKITLNKMNPSITLNNRSLDPRVLKALKTGQIKMPTSPPKAKSPVAAPMTVKRTPTPTDRSEISSQHRTATTMQPGKRKKEQESSRDILDLSGGNKKVDMHPLRIPQPVTKLNKSNKAASSKDSAQLGDISDQGQVVTLMGGHRYYRAPPGSLTPAAHRVNDCPLPSRTPVYAPSFGSVNRSSSDLSSVFPSLPSLYALHQATNLQRYHNNLRLPSQRPATERDLSATGNNSSIGGITGKSHLAAQCAPVKPARSSMASLAVPIDKQQSTDKFVANTNADRTASSDAKKLPAFRNNESLDSTDETPRMIARKRYLSSVESTNNRFSPGNNKDAKSNDQTTVESKTKDSNVESIDINNSKQQQQQQHRETTSPNVVSSTASPSPPPSNSGVNVRSESSTRQGDSVGNVSNEDATPSPTKSNVNTEVTCSKSPVSPDSSSITIESSGVSKSCSTSTDRESTEVQTSSNVVKDPTGFVNPDDSVADDSTATCDDKGKFDKPEVNEITKQLLAVFPSKEWAKNPVAAEHLDNFFKSLNAMKNEESKADKIDRKAATSDSPVKSKKDFVERS